MSPRRGTLAGRRRTAVVGGAGIVATAATIVAIWAAGGSDDAIPPVDRGSSYAPSIISLWLDADRDIGALPARDSWCSGADHCWVFQQLSGDATDYGDTGGWHMSPAVSPRAGVATSLPVRSTGGTVDHTGELSIWSDGANGYYQEASATGTATDLLSITAVVNTSAVAGHAGLFAMYAAGWADFAAVYLDATSGKLVMYANGTTTKNAAVNRDLRDGAWHCVTLVMSQAIGGSKAWVDGTEVSVTGNLDTGGAWAQGAISARWMSSGATQTWGGGVARGKFITQTAWTYADHLAHCGDLWQPPAGGPENDKPLAADDTWTQTGGATCWPTSATTAVCVPGGLTPYTVDATGLAWPTEPDQINRITYSTAISCSTWSCTGTASVTPLQTAPDGSATASLLTVGPTAAANSVINYGLSTFPADAPLYPRFWVKCSSGTLMVYQAHTPAKGRWQVNCSTIGGTWTLIHPGHAAVTEDFAWYSAGALAGVGYYAASGTVTATVWAPTLPTEPGSGRMVIPTKAAAVSSGDIAWAIDNTTGRYYGAGYSVTQSLTTHSGACWVVSGTDLLLSGAGGSECAAAWYGLEIRRP